MSLPRRSAAVLLLTLASACRTTVDFESPRPALLASSAALPVTLSNELRRLRVKSSEAGTKSAYRVGNLLRPLFPARDGQIFLNLVEAELHQERAFDTWQVDFRLVVALQRQGATETLTAGATASSQVGATVAGRNAIERCIEEVYSAVSARLAAPRR